jgi:hypothetical protein
MDKDSMYAAVRGLMECYVIGMHKTDGMILEVGDKHYSLKIVEKKTKYSIDSIIGHTPLPTIQLPANENVSKYNEEIVARNDFNIVEKYKALLDRELSTDKNDYRLTDDEWNTTKIILKDYFARAKEKYKL